MLPTMQALHHKNSCARAVASVRRPAARATALRAPRLRAGSEQQLVVQQQEQQQQRQQESSRFTVSLKKPLGLILEEAADGTLRVAAITEGGAADEAGVLVGDALLATSGVTYGKELDYSGVTVKADMQVIRMVVQGESFKTVSAAIRSHPGHVPVKLEFQRGL